MFEIIILAMIAAFLGLRLYSVLGQRAEHEEEPIPHQFDRTNDQSPRQAQPVQQAQPAIAQLGEIERMMPAVGRGLSAIAASDNRFELGAFMQGSRTAYEMILEAFWAGDEETLRDLCDDDVFAGFSDAIKARKAEGHVLDNKLIRIEETRLHSAELDGRIARIAVLFIADIAAVTRDKDGNVIAGSLDDAVESRDIWTFSRNVGASDPNWVLDETDEG